MPNILIIDDDIIIRKQLFEILKKNFYVVYTAENCQEALQIISETDIDIILLDVVFPDYNGLNIIHTVKQKKSFCEVIVITGFGNQDIAINSLKQGAIDYIEKPIKIEELFTAIGRASEKISEHKNLDYKNTLLIIDDEVAITNPLKHFLEKEGYIVFAAYNCNEGLQIVNNNKIDVIITDIKMADMNGIEVLYQAKKIYQDIEGIMISGYKTQELAVQSLRAGAFDYITKPIDREELLISVHKAIERINLYRIRLYRNRELKISTEIICKMNEELEHRINERTKEINKIQTQLFQTSKLVTLGEMSAGLAHEMNQPLGGISLVTVNLKKLLKIGRLDEKELSYGLSDIENCVKRMSRIIQHIRTFSRQDTLKFIEVNINETINSALSLLNEQFRLHEIELILHMEENLPKIAGEPYQLEQVWINLLTNARDAIDQKENSDKNSCNENYHKMITIITHHLSESREINIDFIDNGIGMSEEEINKAFQPFFTTKEVGKATGLGLSISYGIIESHQGQIYIESKKDEGTLFRVKLKY